MPAFEVREQGGQTRGDGEGEQGGAVGGGCQEVEEGREEEPGGFFFGREAQQVRVEGDDFVVSGQGEGWLVREVWRWRGGEGRGGEGRKGTSRALCRLARLRNSVARLRAGRGKGVAAPRHRRARLRSLF